MMTRYEIKERIVFDVIDTKVDTLQDTLNTKEKAKEVCKELEVYNNERNKH